MRILRKKIPLGVTLSLMFVSAAVAVSATVVVTWRRFSLTVENFSERQAIYQKLGRIDSVVRDNFYGDFENEKLLDNLAKAYIATLDDRFAAYMNAEEYAKANLNSEGKSAGIGITVMPSEDGLISVVEVQKNSPAEKAGVKAGDVIVSVARKSVADIGYDEAVNNLIGKPGTVCIFQVKRGGETKDFSIKREEFDSVSVFSRVIGNVGYVKITAFHNNTDEQFEEAVHDLLEKDVTGLIFDVRNNGGGTLDSVSNMIDLLCPKGDIVSATYKNGRTAVLYSSDASDVDLPMVVLVNGRSASASELFAAALRDFDKAVLVGTQTYGKGVMQTTYPLKDGSAVRITVGLFNPPSGENFNDVGLTPDRIVELTPEQEENFDSLTDETDPQIAAALEILSLGS